MILGLIPARSGSSLKDKNLYLLGGYPLLAWSIAASGMSLGILRTVVTTDSEGYAEIARSYGAETLMRPWEICGADATDITYIQHAIATLNQEFKLIVILRPTTPLRKPIDITKAIEAIYESKDAWISSIRSVHKMSESAYKTLKIEYGCLYGLEVNGFHLTVDEANRPRQSYPDTYQPNGAFDIIKPHLIKEGNLFGDRCVPYETERMDEVDSEEDFEYLEFRLKKHGSIIYDWLRATYPRA